MSETVTVKLEVVAAPSFRLVVDKHVQGGVIGDDVVFIVTCIPIGNFTGTVEVTATGLPSGAIASYDPTDRILAANESLEVTIDTDGCSEEISDIDFSGEVV